MKRPQFGIASPATDTHHETRQNQNTSYAMASNINQEVNNVSTSLLHHPDHHRIRSRHRIPILLSIAVLIGLVSGTLYGFGRYSLALKEHLNIGQVQAQRFGILLDSGNYIGHPLTGYFYDRYGPRASCVGAALVVCFGYGAIALAVASTDDGNGINNNNNNNNNDESNDDITNGMIMLLCQIGFFSVGFGSGLGYISGLGSVTKEFLGRPTLGRAVAGVATGYGLSSTLVGISFHRISDLHGFFLFWGVLVAVVNLGGAVVFAEEKEEGEEEIENDDFMGNEGGRNNGPSSTSGVDAEIPVEQIMQQQQHTPNMEIQSGAPRRQYYRPRGFFFFCTGLQSWTTWQRFDFWILFGSFACVTGCGLFIINNLSTMVQSIGQPDSLAGSLLFLLSICNVAGRILMGSLADLPRVHKISLFQGVASVMLFGLLVSAASPFQEGEYGQSVCLTVTVACVMTAYGGSWVLIVGILADLYGRDDFGKDYGLIAMGPAVSGLIFNSVSALVYEKHAAANGNDGGVCFGNDCYRGSFWMAATAALVGSLILCQMPRTTRSSSIG